MKTFIKLLGLLAVLTFALVPANAQTQDNSDNSISFQTFYDQLASQGNWIQTNDYGYVFQPTVNDPNWRPYTYGHWVDTDDGMMWVSDESFGWATYHYGRWVNLDGYGWVWVPGYTWAPAWVSWREGDDECGWAPLPPDTLADVDYYDDAYGWDFGFHIGDDCDIAFGIGPACYNFCPVAYIGDRDCWRHFRDHRDNFAFINHTRNVTNLNASRDGRGDRFGHVHAGGPSVADLNARSRTPIQHVGLTSASSLAANGRMNGNSLSVFAPNVNRQAATDARPHVVTGTLAQTQVNRGTNINDPQAVNSRIKPAGATPEQIHAASIAGTNATGSAKVATTQTHFSRSLTQPLTALHPNAATGQAGPSTRTGAGNQADTFVTPHVSNPSVPTESRYTGEAATPQTMTHTSTVTTSPHVSAPSFNQPSRFTGEQVTPRTTTRTYSSSGSFHSYTPAPTYHPSTVFHSSTPAYHPQPSFRSSAPAFHSSAPVFHSQPSFHAAPPAQHFGGGAPAAHVSGGNGGGGRSSGGGGQSGGQRGH